MAQSAAFQRFYEDAAAHLPGSIWTGIKPELFAALRDFMQCTNVWTADFDINVDPSSLIYVVTPASGQ